MFLFQFSSCDKFCFVIFATKDGISNFLQHNLGPSPHDRIIITIAF